MKTYHYVCIFLIAIILVSLFCPYRNTIETFQTPTCTVPPGDKARGMDQYYDADCITKGGLGCVGKTGCRFCSNDPSIFKVPCPGGPSGKCTGENQDPFKQCQSGEYTECCDGLDLSYVNGNLQCVKVGPTDKCAGITCPSGQTCDPSTGKCSGPSPGGKLSPCMDGNHLAQAYYGKWSKGQPVSSGCFPYACSGPNQPKGVKEKVSNMDAISDFYGTKKQCTVLFDDQKTNVDDVSGAGYLAYGGKPDIKSSDVTEALNKMKAYPCTEMVCVFDIDGTLDVNCGSKLYSDAVNTCYKAGAKIAVNTLRGYDAQCTDLNTDDRNYGVKPFVQCINNSIGGGPGPSGDCSAPDSTCSGHVSYVQKNLDNYLKNGLNPSDYNNTPLIQQYLYACEDNICGCNPAYGSDKNASIAKFGWKCHAKPSDKCKDVDCPSGKTCDPNTGQCVAGPDPSGKYTLNYNVQEMTNMVKVVKPSSKNYIIVIGDWGAVKQGEWYDGMVKVQKQVAANMQKYVSSMNQNGMNLLFIATTGDNFYTTGLDGPDRLKQVWYDRYNLPVTQDSFGRKSLTDYPWFPTMGNHDWGNADQWALCPNKAPNKKLINGQYYASNQLNSGGRDNNTKNYYMPDFSYHVEVPDLSFEFIAMEANIMDSGGLGGNGLAGGAKLTGQNCGGQGGINSRLQKLNDASNAMLELRAQKSTNNNFLIANHYPSGDCHGWSAKLSGKNVRCIAGHVHNYSCNGPSDGNQCMNVTSGNGGGYGGDGNIMGFYVYGFSDGNPPKLINIGVQQQQMSVPNPP